MNNVVSFFIFILVFSVIVVAHELGHFLIARKNNIKVIEFSVGMGPAIIKFKRNSIQYALRIFPIGGACLFENLEDEEIEEREEHSVTTTAEQKDIPFPNAGVWSRIATIVAGPICNFILAYCLSIILVSNIGTDLPKIGEIEPKSAAYEAGLQPGDIITKMDHQTIHIFREISFFSMFQSGKPIEIRYKRDGKEYQNTLKPKYNEKEERYYLGLRMVNQYQKLKPLQVLEYSFYETKYYVDVTIKSLGMLFTGQVSVRELSGPVGMATTVKDIYTQSKDDGLYYVFMNMLMFTILLSANLGVLNLLPIPALDGGRLSFLLIEAVRKNPVPPKQEGVVHAMGFVLLMIIMVLVLFQDISRLF